MREGDRVGKYRAERRLGRGAMGEVWAAVHVDTGKEVALKLLVPGSDEHRPRLLREARACGQVVHRNVVALYDVDTTPEGDPYLVMARLTGETLGQLLRRERKLAPAVVARIGAEIAAGLGAAHALGVVHRDLKPDNVFLHRESGAAEPVVKLVDFGVSRIEAAGTPRLTATGELVGSPAYMSPEHAGSPDQISPRSDLWSLGAVLFEMLTGRRLFDGTSLPQVVLQVLQDPIPSPASLDPEIPEALAAVVLACLERDPERRPASAAQVVERLRAWRSGRAVAAPPAPPVAPAPWTAPPAPPAAASSVDTTPMITTPLLRAPPPAEQATLPMVTTPMIRRGLVPTAAPGATPLRRGLAAAAGTVVLAGGVVALLLHASPEPPPPPPAPSASASAPPPAPPPAPAFVERPRRYERPKGPTVKLVVESEQPAEVYVDDRLAGSTPMPALAVSPGAHVLRFVHAARGERRVTVEAKLGVSMVMRVDFEKDEER